MNLGAAWIIVEESFHNTERHLVSIISARKKHEYIRDFMEQRYVDKFASVDERIAYKKNRKQSPFRIENYEITGTIISCGHDPIFNAYYCHKLMLAENTLTFTYRVFIGDYEHRVTNEFVRTVVVA